MIEALVLCLKVMGVFILLRCWLFYYSLKDMQQRSLRDKFSEKEEELFELHLQLSNSSRPLFEDLLRKNNEIIKLCLGSYAEVTSRTPYPTQASMTTIPPSTVSTRVLSPTRRDRQDRRHPLQLPLRVPQDPPRGREEAFPARQRRLHDQERTQNTREGRTPGSIPLQ